MNKKLVVVAVMLSVLLIMPATSYQTSMADNFRIEGKHGAASDGNTLYVGGSGPNNYTKIQDAIDDADDGDKIFVYSGVYTETVTVSKSIVLAGEDKYSTVIYGNETVLKIVCDGVTIQSFSIKCGSSNYNDSSILIRGDYVVVEKNIISDSRCTGISLKSSSYCKISGNIIKNNSYDGISITEESNSNNISNNDIESGMYRHFLSAHNLPVRPAGLEVVFCNYQYGY